MGRDRSLIRNAFEEGAVIDTEEDITHGLDKTRPRKELEKKVENGKTKVQIWVKKDTLEYQRKLSLLQIELIKLQNYVKEKGLKVLLIFEGRDAAGKGGTIKRITEHLNPRGARVVALVKPSDVEKTQWYFQRYVQHLPSAGEIVLFDRSWYNRAGVEPVMGFCTPEQYESFMVQVPEFEHMLYEAGTIIIKFWFSVNKDEQLARFKGRLKNPLKKWKYSPVDEKGQELWDKFTYYKDQMFSRTHNAFSPWIIVKSDNKLNARLEAIRYVLSLFEYEGKENAKVNLNTDPNVLQRYFRMVKQID